MNRKTAFRIFRAAVALLALAAATAAGQSPGPQQQRLPDQAKKSDDDDLINPDRPGIADGSAVIGAGRIQVEGGIQQEFRRQDGVREHTLFVPALLRIGISSHWEARIEGNSLTRETDLEPGGVSNHIVGLAPFSFGLKYQIGDSKGVTHPSTGVIVRVFPAWGTGDFRTHHVTGDLRFAADWDFAPKLSLNPNAGVALYEDANGKEFAAGLFAVTLNYLPSKRLNPFIDLGVQSPEEKQGQSSLIVDAGMAYIARRNVQLDASIGTGAHGHTPAHPFISFGVSFRSDFFGHRK